jgi:hypothetical protein
MLKVSGGFPFAVYGDGLRRISRRSGWFRAQNPDIPVNAKVTAQAVRGDLKDCWPSRS